MLPSVPYVPQNLCLSPIQGGLGNQPADRKCIRWASPLLEGHGLALSNWDAFLQQYQPYLMTHTELQWLRPPQGGVPYVAHFHHLTENTQWNEAAQLYLFRWSWQEETKDELAHTGAYRPR